jgi:hypothetical protein
VRASFVNEVSASFPARTTLTNQDRVVLRAVAEAMFSEDGEVEDARLDAHLDEVDAYVSCASKPLRAGLRFALFVVRIAPLLLFFRLRTIESLSCAERALVLSRLERSPLAYLSLAFIGWRTVMTFVFYEHPTELATLGYATERKVFKRRLALVPALASLPSLPSLAAPEAAESGVRLRDVDSESLVAATELVDANDTNKVA